MVDDIRDDADNEITRIVRRPGPAKLPVNLVRPVGQVSIAPESAPQGRAGAEPMSPQPAAVKSTTVDETVVAAPQRGPAAANDSAPHVVPPVALDRQRPDRPQMMPPRPTPQASAPVPSTPARIAPNVVDSEPVIGRPMPPQPSAGADVPRPPPSPEAVALPAIDAQKPIAAPAPAPVAPPAGLVAASEPIEPVVGWLVIVKGPGRGIARQIVTGRNGIGSAAGQDIRLDFGDAAIAPHGHAYIVYDDEAREFVVEDGKQKVVVRLNGKLLTETMPIGHGDELRIGATTLKFVALCGADFDWDDQEKVAEVAPPVDPGSDVVVVITEG